MRTITTLFIFLVLLVDNANAEPIDAQSQVGQTVTTYFSILEDPDHSLSMSDLLSPSKNEFQWHQINKQTLSMGVSDSKYWLRADLKNPSDVDQTLLLEISYPGLSNVDFFLIDKSQGKKHLVHKESIPFNQKVKERNIKSAFPIFSMELAPNSKYELYISSHSIYPIVFPIKLKTIDQYQTEEQFRLTLNGIFFGSMFAMIIFNLFLCLVTKDNSYFWYVVFELLSVLVVSFDQGIIPGFVRMSGIESTFTLFNIICLFNSMVAGKFAITYLSLREEDPFLWKLALSGIYVGLFLIGVALLFRESFITLLIFLLLIVYGSVAIYIGIRRSKHGDPFARFYLVAWFFAISFGMISTAARLGAFNYNLFTQYAFHFGYIAEAAIFSLGLGYRINMLSRDKQKEKEKAIQAQAETAKDRAINEERIKSRTQFFASMSHEFRTPLTTILGYSDIAQDPKIVENQRLEYLKTISISAQHMLQLINDILDFSKIEANKMEMHIRSVDLIELLTEVKSMLSVLAERKALDLQIECLFPLPSSIQTDFVRVKQVLVNLGANAIKFTNKGSVKIVISYDKINSTTFFSVIDTGIGIKEEALGKLFGAFEQADGDTSGKQEGTGLGLYLSKLIANNLGGDIQAQSEFGQGSEFTFSIHAEPNSEAKWLNSLPTTVAFNQNPLKNEDHAKLDNPDERAPLKHQVLVVEDNQINSQLLTHHLLKMGCEISTAVDGLEAISKTLNEPIDLILMDINMPVMDGLTASQFLREKGISTPIYILTGDTTQETIEKCKKAGCSGHLSKPYDTNEIKNVVDFHFPN